MTLSDNILLMKTLLRTGWIRAGVPKCEIESLADHSWGVSILTFFFCIEENSLRKAQNRSVLDIEKALALALLHDFPESESLDIDKSIHRLIDSERLNSFINDIANEAIRQIVSRSSPEVGRRIISVLSDKESQEYQLVRIADQIDLILQAKHYSNKNWIKREDSDSFLNQALNTLSFYSDKFLFLTEYLKELHSDE